MRYLLYILTLGFLLALTMAHKTNSTTHALGDNVLQKRHHEHRNGFGEQSVVTKWNTKLVTLFRTKTMTRTRTKTAIQRIITTKIINKVVPAPTTVWKTRNVPTTKTVMKLSVATVTRQFVSTIIANVTPKISTITKTLTKEFVVNKSTTKMITKTVTKEYVTTTTTTQSPKLITITQTQFDIGAQTVFGNCSTKMEISTIFVTVTETATNSVINTIPTTITKEVTVLETISQSIPSPATITETITVTGSPGLITESGPTMTVTVTEMSSSICPSAVSETVYTQIGLTTSSTLLDFPITSSTSVTSNPTPTRLSSATDPSLSESAPPSTGLTFMTTSTTTDLHNPPPSPSCTFEPTILRSNFEQGVAADLWDLTTLPYGTTGTSPLLSSPLSAHGGLRAVRIRAGAASQPKVRMGITRDISSGICSGHGYVVSVWVMAPLLQDSLVGRCTIELWWSETVAALRSGRRLLGSDVVPENGVWRKVQGTFIQASGVEAGQLQIVMSCDGTGERYLYLDDVEIVRMS